MNWVDTIGYIAAAFTTFAFLPQLIKIIKNKKANDVSLLMYLVMLTGIGLWLAYGIMIHSLPVIAANSLTFLFVLAILFLKVRFK